VRFISTGGIRCGCSACAVKDAWGAGGGRARGTADKEKDTGGNGWEVDTGLKMARAPQTSFAEDGLESQMNSLVWGITEDGRRQCGAGGEERLWRGRIKLCRRGSLTARELRDRCALSERFSHAELHEIHEVLHLALLAPLFVAIPLFVACGHAVNILCIFDQDSKGQSHSSWTSSSIKSRLNNGLIAGLDGCSSRVSCVAFNDLYALSASFEVAFTMVSVDPCLHRHQCVVSSTLCRDPLPRMIAPMKHPSLTCSPVGD
jgi:hypothetical protein